MAKIIERTDEEIVMGNPEKVFRAAQANMNVPDALFGKYVTAVAVVTNVELDATQQAQLETAIEGITGVTLSKILVEPSRLSGDRLPADVAGVTDYQLRVYLKMGFDTVANDISGT